MTSCEDTRQVELEEFKPFEGPEPVAVFIETDPWAKVIGSDTPRFALYSDRTVIFLRTEKNRKSLRTATLKKERFDELRQRFLSVAKLSKLKHSYNMAPHVTSQPKAMFYMQSGNEEVTSTVYGLVAADTPIRSHTSFPTSEEPDTPPKELLDLHNFLVTFDLPHAEEWEPKFIEVMIGPYENAPDPSIHWPADWPGLESDRAFKRGGSYSIFIDGEKLPKLTDFLASRKQKGAVEIGGKKWGASYRHMFSNEPVWRQAFRDSRIKAAEK